MISTTSGRPRSCAPLVFDDGEATYNPDPLAYHAFEQYTVAHEGNPLGNYANLRRLEPPVPAEATPTSGCNCGC